MFTNQAIAQTLVAEHIRDLENTARTWRSLKRRRWGPPSTAVRRISIRHTPERTLDRAA